MRVFAIGDLHLESGTGKTMDRFGEHWKDHETRIFEAWDRLANDSDLLILCGDLSWATRLVEVRPDLDRIGSMKGRKILIKGNHDFWWESVAKLRRVIDSSVEIVSASSVIIGRVAVAGTRGWTCPAEANFDERDRKIYEREVGRLRLALESLRGRESEFDFLIVALHYPPTNDLREPSGFTGLVEEFSADACVYGHLHDRAISSGLAGAHGGTIYHVVSADAVDFAPALIHTTLDGGPE